MKLINSIVAGLKKALRYAEIGQASIDTIKFAIERFSRINLEEDNTINAKEALNTNTEEK
ncbi:MAG: hypothetical protein V4613_03615 [Bacteroidota bacterium]